MEHEAALPAAPPGTLGTSAMRPHALAPPSTQSTRGGSPPVPRRCGRIAVGAGRPRARASPRARRPRPPSPPLPSPSSEVTARGRAQPRGPRRGSGAAAAGGSPPPVGGGKAAHPTSAGPLAAAWPFLAFFFPLPGCKFPQRS